MLMLMGIIVLNDFVRLPQNLALLLRGKLLNLISMVVDVIQRFLIITYRWAMFMFRITIPLIGSTIIDRTWIVPVGRSRIEPISIVHWWRIRISIAPAIGVSWKGWIAPIVGTA